MLAVPEIAVTQGLMGPLVYVLDDENKARERTVQLGEVAGPWQIIRDGLEPGDRVVVGDPAGLEAGVLIDPQPFSGSATEVVEEAMQEDAQEEAQAAEAMQQADGAQPAAEGEEGAQ